MVLQKTLAALALLVTAITPLISGDINCVDTGGDTHGIAWTYLSKLQGETLHIAGSSFTNSTYTIGICTNVYSNDSSEHAGVVEHTQDNKTIVVGRYNTSRLMSGSHWILLTYLNGDNYTDNICNNEPRQAAIMLTCNHDQEKFDKVTVITENLNRSRECYHLFETEHCLACVSDGCDAFFHTFSPGSLILIGFFSLAGAYLLFGWIYQRCVAGHRGWNQIPNAAFWREIGHLQADGCVFACKCGTRPEDEYYTVAGSSDYNNPSGHHGSSLLSDDENMLPP